MKYKLLVVFLFVIGAFLRLYNFENRLIFGPEQAISLINSAANLDRFSLLGEYNLQRTTSTGLNLIHGPLFSYFLLPFVVLFNFKALPISLVFPILNLFTGLVLFLVVKKIFGNLVAIFSLLFFLLSSLMIYHSLFIWINHPLILLGILTIWYVSQLYKNRWSAAPVILLGILMGIGFNLQYPFLSFTVFIFILVALVTRQLIKTTALFWSGFLVANTSRIIFDLRHDFYHIRVLWQFLLDVYYYHAVNAELYSYHYLHLFPIFCILLALLTAGIYRMNKFLAFGVVGIYLILNLQSSYLNLNKSLGMPDGITLKTLETAAGTIAGDNLPARFNVVTLWDFDTVARPMRYLLKYYYHLELQPFENYANVDAIYAFAPKDYDFNHPGVWELKTFAPYKITTLKSPSDLYVLYKLTK